MADAAELPTGLESEMNSCTHICFLHLSITGSILGGGHRGCRASNPGDPGPQVCAAEHDRLGLAENERVNLQTGAGSESTITGRREAEDKGDSESTAFWNHVSSQRRTEPALPALFQKLP